MGRGGENGKVSGVVQFKSIQFNLNMVFLNSDYACGGAVNLALPKL